MIHPSPSKGDLTRQAIMESAYDLFLNQGYAATSMRQIADRANLALGGIYNHFQGKEAIFSQLILERHPYRYVMPILKEIPEDDPESFIRSAARAMLTELERNPDFVKLMFIEIVEFKGRNIPAIIETVLPEILPVIQRFSPQKDQLRDIPPFVFLRAFIGLFFSFYITETVIKDTVLAGSKAHALESFIEIFLHGILADKEKA